MCSTHETLYHGIFFQFYIPFIMLENAYMNFGYVIIAILYLILTSKQDDRTKWLLYGAIGATYMWMGVTERSEGYSQA